MNWDKENQLFTQGYQFLAGIDEAGRGPLAGPVVAGLVILSHQDDQDPKNNYLQTINDSKKLTPKKRKELFDFIIDNFPTAIGVCDNKTIDRINIRQATFLAIKKALGQIKTKPHMILLDGNSTLPNCSYPQQCIKNGDASVFAIAAASIVAKVTRDQIMADLHQKYPDYGFDRHKGYGTKIHLENIEKLGPSPIHRTSFNPVSKFSSCI